METFTDFIDTIFGEYTPSLVIDETSGTVVEGVINFGYIASVVIFIIFVYFVLKTIGGILYEWLR